MGHGSLNRLEVVQVIDRVLKFISAAFHGVLGLFCLGVGLLAYLTNMGNSLKMTMMPWFNGPYLAAWLLGLGALGVCLAILFFLGKLKPVFFVWALFVFITMVYGYASGAHVFRHVSEAWNALYLTLGAIVALFGAWRNLDRKRRA